MHAALWTTQALMINPCVLYRVESGGCVVAQNLSPKGRLRRLPQNFLHTSLTAYLYTRYQHSIKSRRFQYDWLNDLPCATLKDYEQHLPQITSHFLSPNWCASLQMADDPKHTPLHRSTYRLQGFTRLFFQKHWKPLSPVLWRYPWKRWRQQLRTSQRPCGVYRLTMNSVHERLDWLNDLGPGMEDLLPEIEARRWGLFLAVDGPTKALVAGSVSSAGLLHHSPHFLLTA